MDHHCTLEHGPVTEEDAGFIEAATGVGTAAVVAVQPNERTAVHTKPLKARLMCRLRKSWARLSVSKGLVITSYLVDNRGHGKPQRP
jgi:hypothetical protein